MIFGRYTKTNNSNRSKYKTKKGPITYAQRKRDSFEYREEFFKKHKGPTWFCAYCGCVLTEKKMVHVDHIIPLNSTFGRNSMYNLVSACAECNLNKSDKVDYRIVKGYYAKVKHSIFELIGWAIRQAFLIIYYIVSFILRLIYQAIKTPFKGTSITTKIIVLIIYGFAASFLLKKFGIL